MGKISSPPGFDPRTAIDELNNSKVKFWLEQFRSGRVGANDYHRDRDGGLIKETKKNSLPCHFTHRDVGTTRFFTSKNLTNNIRPEDVDFYLKAVFPRIMKKFTTLTKIWVLAYYHVQNSNSLFATASV